MKKIIILGASGSIGMQTIDVCLRNKEQFEIVGISIGKNTEALKSILKQVNIQNVCTQIPFEDISEYENINFFNGEEGLLKLLDVQCDLVVNALVGFVGLKPTLYAIEKGYDIALANKETLVVAGEIVMANAKNKNVNILPIDSEHSALFQCLQGNDIKSVNKLIVTASGGSFRDLSRNDLKGVTVEQALAHPNWSMGAKITIDSATMMNKGFEVIEAHWLFDIDYNKIDVLMHPQSIVHSIVEYCDGSQIAQLGLSDMRIPIQYAMTYPNRIELDTPKLDLASIGTLTFKEVSFDRFPLLKVAFEVGRAKGNAPCILNAANEIANQAFRDGLISFINIEDYVIDALKLIEFKQKINLEDIYYYDKFTREFVKKRIKDAIYN